MAGKTKTRPRRHSHHLTPKQSVAVAASQEGVPFWVLWGVKVAETGSGWGLGEESSTGAKGPFQFEPETAAAYGVNVDNFMSSARGAAKYLKQLKHEHGTWNSALEYYSGHGYGESHVLEKAAETGVTKRTTTRRVLADVKTPFGTIPAPGPELDFTNPLGPLNPINPTELGIPDVQNPFGIGGGSGGSIFSLPSEVVEAFQQFTKLSKLVSSPQFWVRAGEAIGGIILLYMALKALTGTGVSDLPGGRAAVSYGKMAAFKRLPPAARVKKG